MFMRPSPKGDGEKPSAAAPGEPRSMPSPGRAGRIAIVPSYAPFRGWLRCTIWYPRLCAVGYFLSPFGLAPMWGRIGPLTYDAIRLSVEKEGRRRSLEEREPYSGPAPRGSRPMRQG